jgi:hypothetical protein
LSDARRNTGHARPALGGRRALIAFFERAHAERATRASRGTCTATDPATAAASGAASCATLAAFAGFTRWPTATAFVVTTTGADENCESECDGTNQAEAQVCALAHEDLLQTI